MPQSPENLRRLSAGDFRRERAYLADEVFAIAPGENTPPTDPISEAVWEGLTHLATDALLRTSDYRGTMLADAYEQAVEWVMVTPLKASQSEFMFEAALDASDELHAAPFIAAHGYYRQATAGLRNALEGLACAAALAVHEDRDMYGRWRDGGYEPKFGNMIERLAEAPLLTGLDAALGNGGLFGRKPKGLLSTVYADLCRYAHNRPGHTNVDIWQSNGPIFVSAGFTQFWIDFCDAIALCYVLLKIGWDDLVLPDEARPLFGFANERWNGLGLKIEAKFFPVPPDGSDD